MMCLGDTLCPHSGINSRRARVRHLLVVQGKTTVAPLDSPPYYLPFSLSLYCQYHLKLHQNLPFIVRNISQFLLLVDWVLLEFEATGNNLEQRK